MGVTNSETRTPSKKANNSALGRKVSPTKLISLDLQKGIKSVDTEISVSDETLSTTSVLVPYLICVCVVVVTVSDIVV